MEPLHIVVGVDGSASSVQALMWAAEVAANRNVPLVMVHAGATKTAHDLLDQAQAMVSAEFRDVRCLPELSEAAPAHALIAASQSAALVVVGSRGHGGIHDLLLGSTSLQVSMHASCPVAVVRASPASQGRIVVGVDASPHSQGALEYAFLEADLTGKPVLALHVYASPLIGYPDALIPLPNARAERDRATDLLARELFAWQEAFPEVQVAQRAVQGSPAQVLAEHSKGANLAVVGSRGLSGFTGLLLGSTSRALIHHAGCPVVIARLRRGGRGAWAHLPS